MYYNLRLVRLGSKWYADLEHETPDQIRLSYKLDRFLNYIDTYNTGCVDVMLFRQDIVIHSVGLIELRDADVTKLLVDDMPFILQIKIGGHTFAVSSKLIETLAKNGIDLIKDIYRIDL